MAYRVEIGPKADVQLSELDPAIGSAVERKIMWLAENAGVMIHRRLVGMPVILPVCANYERAIGAFFTGFITRTKRCASIESSTAPKRIAVSDANCAVRSMLVCPKLACQAEALAKAGHLFAQRRTRRGGSLVTFLNESGVSSAFTEIA